MARLRSSRGTQPSSEVRLIARGALPEPGSGRGGLRGGEAHKSGGQCNRGRVGQQDGGLVNKGTKGVVERKWPRGGKNGKENGAAYRNRTDT